MMEVGLQEKPDSMLKNEQEDWHPSMDRGAHQDMYVLFLRLCKWSVISVAALLIFLLLFVK